MAIAFGKANVTNDASDKTVVVRTAKFPTAGRKVLIQKGTCKISIDAIDLLPFVDYVKEAALTASLGQDA